MTIRVVLMDRDGETCREWESRSEVLASEFVEKHSVLLLNGLVYLNLREDEFIVSLTDHKQVLVTGPADFVEKELRSLFVAE